MREIKFRAWKPFEQKMQSTILGSVGFRDGDAGRLFYRATAMIDDQSGLSGFDWNLMQYTGLHDKNGDEIYEGDVVKGLAGENWVVEWYNTGWTLRCTCHYPDGDFYSLNGKEVEVIGNIWENPELLK